jgi:DNA-binding NtrC family response regulator
MSQRILLIDDDPPMLKQLARILDERTSYEIRTEGNSLEVPRILEQEEFDLIITDLGMPGLDGMEILRLIRSSQRFEEVVIITAFGSMGSVLEAVSEGVFDYVIKPFRKSQIVEIVERAMRFQRRKREDRQLTDICTREPYREAEPLFRREYLRRLAARAGGDPEEVARRSDLDAEEVARALDRSETGPRGREE